MHCYHIMLNIRSFLRETRSMLFNFREHGLPGNKICNIIRHSYRAARQPDQPRRSRDSRANREKIKQIKRHYSRHKHHNYPHLAAIDSLRIIEYTRVPGPGAGGAPSHTRAAPHLITTEKEANNQVDALQ